MAITAGETTPATPLTAGEATPALPAAATPQTDAAKKGATPKGEGVTPKGDGVTPPPKGGRGKKRGAGAADSDAESTASGVKSTKATTISDAFNKAKHTILTLNACIANYQSLKTAIEHDGRYKLWRSEGAQEDMTTAFKELEKVLKDPFLNEFRLNQNLQVLKKTYKEEPELIWKLSTIPAIDDKLGVLNKEIRNIINMQASRKD